MSGGTKLPWASIWIVADFTPSKVLTAFPPADWLDPDGVDASPFPFDVGLEMRLQDRLPATKTLMARSILPLDWDITALLPLKVVCAGLLPADKYRFVFAKRKLLPLGGGQATHRSGLR